MVEYLASEAVRETQSIGSRRGTTMNRMTLRFCRWPFFSQPKNRVRPMPLSIKTNLFEVVSDFESRIDPDHP